MKKILSVIVVLVLLGGAGYLYLGSKNKKSDIPTKNANVETHNKKPVFKSIKEALSKSMNLKCAYKDEKGIETKSYLKNGVIRMMRSTKNDKQPDNFIINKNKMYAWNDKTKKGIVFTVKKSEETIVPPSSENEKEMPKANDNQKEATLAQFEKYKNYCKVENVDNSIITVPANVKFQDLNALKNQLMR